MYTHQCAYIPDLKLKLSKTYSLWDAMYLENFDFKNKCIKLDIKEKDLKAIMKAYEILEQEKDFFKQELKEALSKNQDTKTFEIKSNIVEYLFRFSKLVDGVFSKYLDNFSLNLKMKNDTI